MTENQLRKEIVRRAEYYIDAGFGSNKHHEIVDAYNSHKPLARGYALKYDDDYCAGFVSAVGILNGLQDIIFPEVGCGKMIDLYKENGRWVEEDGFIPKPGDLIFFDWDDSGEGDNQNSPDHVALVAYVSGQTITAIQGNDSHGAISYVEIGVNGTFIRGFGVPDFASIADEQEDEKTIDELANEVLAGEWGNGADRQNRLADAGYDYATVQMRVNELLSASSDDTNEKIARQVIQGLWGNGAERREKLEAAGYDYSAIQEKVNKLLS